MLKLLRKAYDKHLIAQRGTLAERFPQYSFGRGTYGDDLRVRDWGEGATLKVGNFCSIAAGAQIFLGGNHRTDWVTTYPFPAFADQWPGAAKIDGHPATRGDVRIGNDVWIGAEAVVLSGVTIGDGAVIGARAVVARDVPPYAVVVGNPAAVVRHRFDEATIARLLRVQWWHWPDEKIARLMPLLLNENTDAFLLAAERAEA